MNILIYGLGGIGGYIGSFLVRTKHNIVFLTKKNKIEIFTNKGLVLNSLGRKIVSKKIKIIDYLDSNSNYDIIVLAVKLYDFDESIMEIKRKVKNDTIILPFQNGVYSEEVIKKNFGSKNSFGAVAQISCYQNDNYQFIHVGNLATFFVGGYTNKSQVKRLEKFALDCQSVGLDARFTKKINEKLWEKFIFLSAYSGMTTLTLKTIGEIFDSIELKEMFLSAMNETYEISKKFGVKFSKQPVNYWHEKILKMPYKMTSSMYLDCKKEKKLELDWLSGFVVNFAEKNFMNCEIHKKIVDGIKSR